jgi:hypothetical protein
LPCPWFVCLWWRARAEVAQSELVTEKRQLTIRYHRLEALIRSNLAENNHDRIAKIVHQLCHDYAYAVHQPHARNGGLIGLAAAAIALGSVRVSLQFSLEAESKQHHTKDSQY